MDRAITFDIFCCKLNNLYHLTPGRGFTGGRQLKNVRLHDGIHFDPDYLYVAEWDDYKGNRKRNGGCTAVLTGCPQDVAVDGNTVQISEPVPAAQIFCEATEIFAEFYQWREGLHDFDLSGQGLNELLIQASKFMETELMITDSAYQTPFSTLVGKGKKDDPLGIIAMSGEYSQTLLNTQPEFAESFRTRGVQPYPSFYNGLLYYDNIFDGDEYLARLVTVFAEQPFYQGRVRMIGYLSEFVERAYLRYHRNISRTRKNARFLTALRSLLTVGEADDEAVAGQMAEALSDFGWHSHHTYQVMLLDLTEYQGNLVSRNYFCAQFDQKFPSCSTLLLDEEIISVRNLSVETAETGFDRNFPYFLRDNLCRAGVSNRVCGAGRLHQLASQARDALQFGRQKNSTMWCWHFGDYVLDYLRLQAVRQYPADQLSHRALGILKEYDRQNHSALYETLHIFVRQRFSASAAAKALFIHRSTFLHRLNRIMELTKLDFSDERQRLWLTLSYFLQEG